MEQDKNQVIMQTINSVLKNKLEKIVLDTMSHPEEVPSDIFQSMEIAKQMGYKDTLIGFDEIFREIGEIQTARIIEKRNKRITIREEKELQDYLVANPQKLQEIELGITFMDQEVTRKSGRLDILTKGSDENEVKIELKAKDYNTRNVFMQIMKYFHDDETGNARLHFVAPVVKPDLLFALRAYQEAGRMGFFEFERINGDYFFRPISAKDITEPKQINWSRRKRKSQEENKTIRVTATAGKTRSERTETKEISQEPIKFQGGEVIPQGSFHKEWESYPLYYQIIIMTNPRLENREKYLQPIEIEYDQKSCLESLITSNKFESTKRDFEAHLPWHRKDMKELSHRIKFRASTRSLEIAKRRFTQGFQIGAKYDKLFREVLCNMASIILATNNEKFNNMLEHLQNVQTDMERILITAKYRDPKFSDFKESLRKGSKTAYMTNDALMDSYTKGMLFLNELYKESLVNEFLKLKVARTRELAKLDRVIAFSYLCFNPAQVPSFLEIKKTEGGEMIGTVRLYPEKIYEFIKQDQELYKSILSAFKSKEDAYVNQISLQENKESLPNLQENAQMQVIAEQQKFQNIAAPKNKSLEKRALELPISAVIPNKVFGNMKPKERQAVQAFVSEILNSKGYSAPVKKKIADISRNSGWYNREISKEYIEHFFKGLVTAAERDDLDIEPKTYFQRWCAYSILSNHVYWVLKKRTQNRIIGTYDESTKILSLDTYALNSMIKTSYTNWEYYSLQSKGLASDLISEGIQKGVFKIGKVDTKKIIGKPIQI